MKVHEKIRLVRELKKWSQEDVAGQLDMSVNGYAKIERGETQLTVPRLRKIAEVLNMDIKDLIQDDRQGWVVIFGENSTTTGTYMNSVNLSEHSGQLIVEIEKLQLIIEHKNALLLQKDEMLLQKDKELAMKDEIIALLKSK